MSPLRCLRCAILLCAVIAFNAFADTAPDATATGPLAITTMEYKRPAEWDLDVAGLPTELWARVWMPNALPDQPMPVLVFLHGNHGTCGIGSNPRNDNNTEYTFYGTCPPGYVVTPNHEGYTYLAQRLASWGYFVVSINANRGINAAPGPSDDLGLNLARGRLLLKHLALLSEWNHLGGSGDLGIDLTGKLDFGNVGLFGHSRGGEGVRAAYNFYTFGDPNVDWGQRIQDQVNFDGIFEIGPVDGQTSLVLDPTGVPWNVLLPMCDGDVSNLQGIRPFDRAMMSGAGDPNRKSNFAVWGANHNYFNTEWQLSDSPGCTGPGNLPLFTMPVGSPSQRQTSLASVMAFFRGNVVNQVVTSPPAFDPTFMENFNPQFVLPSVVTSVTRVDRGYTDSPDPGVTAVFEDFTQVTGTNTNGTANDMANIVIAHGANQIPNHNSVDPYGRATNKRSASISWTATSGFFQTNWTPAGTGNPIDGYQTLDFRVSRQCSTISCTMPHPSNPAGPTDFSIRLVMGNGTMSDPVKLSSYADLRGPVGTGFPALHPILQTARIPLGDFPNADLTSVRGVRFSFDITATGAIYLSDIRLSLFSGPPDPQIPPTPTNPPLSSPIVTAGDVNVIKAVRALTSSTALKGVAAAEVDVQSNRLFTVHDNLFVMRIGNLSSLMGRYPNTGETNTLIFTFPADILTQSLGGQPVTVQYGLEPSPQDWNFGNLDPSLLPH